MTRSSDGRRRMSRRRPPWHRLISTAHVDTLPTKFLEALRTRRSYGIYHTGRDPALDHLAETIMMMVGEAVALSVKHSNNQLKLRYPARSCLFIQESCLSPHPSSQRVCNKHVTQSLAYTGLALIWVLNLVPYTYIWTDWSTSDRPESTKPR